MCSRPFRPFGLPIYVARVPAAPFTRSYPRRFTFYVADPISSIREQAERASSTKVGEPDGSGRQRFRKRDACATSLRLRSAADD
jgi:hypothetical protein